MCVATARVLRTFMAPPADRLPAVTRSHPLIILQHDIEDFQRSSADNDRFCEGFRMPARACDGAVRTYASAPP
jgi:hypothetical protein